MCLSKAHLRVVNDQQESSDQSEIFGGGQMPRNRAIPFAAMLLWPGSSFASGDQPSNLHYTFEDTIPASITWSAGSRLTISDQQSKDGTHSLKWEFRSGDYLKLKKGFGPIKSHTSGGRQEVPAFVMWIFSEELSESQLTVSVRGNGVVLCDFNLTLNFVGWRSLLVPYVDDMKCPQQMNIDTIKIAVHNVRGFGVLFFDTLLPKVNLDPRSPTPDVHLPFVNPRTAASANGHWTGLLRYDEWYHENNRERPPDTALPGPTGISWIEARTDDALLGEANLSKLPSLTDLEKTLQSFQIKTSNGARRIRPVALPAHSEYLGGVTTYGSGSLPQDMLQFRDVGRFMWQLAVRYRLSDSEKQRQKLLDAFVWTASQLHSQGYAAGSGTGIIHHAGYSIREWAKALYLMRDQLGPLREQQQKDLTWFTGLGRVYRPEEEITGFNTDVMNTLLQGMLFSVLLDEDSGRRTRQLHQLSRWMSVSLLSTRGLGGGIQPDGTLFHHSQHYVAYGNDGLAGLTSVVYFLADTPYAISAEAMERLRHGVLMTRIFANDRKIPMSLSGRHPNGMAGISTVPFSYLSRIAASDGSPDAEIIGAYLRLTDAEPDDQHAKALLDLGFRAESAPVGSWVFPYSNLVIQRRDEWLASARGFSRYLVGNESYESANLFGRFMNYGHVEILPNRSELRGFRENGWDWSRWPGTTSPHLSLDELRADVGQGDPFSGREEMLLSDQTFSGGTVLRATNSMFAQILHGHSKYDDSFWARKSVFFFDNRIVALGSGISYDDTRNSVETTLYQHALSSPNQATFFNGRPHTGLAFKKEFATTGGEYLVDPAGNAYIPAPGQELILFRQTQESMDNRAKVPTDGNFATAVLNHGVAPNNAKYEYAILVSSTQGRASEFAHSLLDRNQAAYHVLRHDNGAHIVWDRETDSTAYALFDAGPVNVDRPLITSDTPIMLMTRQSSGELMVSVSNPDLSLYDGNEIDQVGHNGEQLEVSIYSRSWRFSRPRPQTIVIEFSGAWTIVDQSAKVAVKERLNDSTQIEISTVGGAPVEFSLLRLQ